MNVLINQFINIFKEEEDTHIIEVILPANYFFKPNDDIVISKLIINNIQLENTLAKVISYHPSNTERHFRLLVKLKTTSEEIFINPSRATPINNTHYYDKRQRLYLTNDDSIKFLNNLLNEFIIMLPLHAIGEKLVYKIPLTVFGSNSSISRSSINVQHIINMPNKGFLYLGIDSVFKRPTVVVHRYTSDGSYKQFYLSIDTETYQKLLLQNELNIC